MIYIFLLINILYISVFITEILHMEHVQKNTDSWVPILAESLGLGGAWEYECVTYFLDDYDI